MNIRRESVPLSLRFPTRCIASRLTTGFLFAVLLASSPRVPGAQNPCDVIYGAVIPSSGIAPLQVRLTGEGMGSVTFVYIDMGDGTLDHQWIGDPLAVDCGIGWPFQFEHEYFCPGVYEIVVTEGGNTVGSSPAEARWTVTVTAPELPLQVQEPYEDTFEIHTTAELPTAESYFSSTIDWGDGTVGPLTWVSAGSGFKTPAHTYGEMGSYTVTITSHYVGEKCSYDVTNSVEVPGNANPAETTTWGRIKAIYDTDG